MIISVNWLKKFTEIDLPIDKLAELIGARLVEIEEITDIGAKYKDTIVAKVVKVEDHPDADRLHVVQLDDGGKAKEVKRLENGNVQVVCGAPNVREGLMVAWLPPGSTVPETYGGTEPFVLDSRKLRGIVSNGMIASGKELAFNADHDGILEVDASDVKAGDSFADVYELNDYLLDIENKSLTHRPDTFGLVGFAREVAAIQGKAFQTPEWLKALEPRLYDKDTVEGLVEPKVTIENPEVSARYEAVVLAGVEVGKPSPLQIQSYLYRIGVRPINAAVDITNYLMMVTGQPLHAFDYDKFVKVGDTKGPEVTVREAKKDEKLTLLDGKEIVLASDDIVIASGKTPVALAGAMGGASTEIDEHTKNILLESATFDLYRLRTTQMRHGIFSEAITRFTKGQPAALTAPVLASAIRMFISIAGATRASDIVDSYPQPEKQPTLKIPLAKIQQVLGAELDAGEASKPLENVEFTVDSKTNDVLMVTSPYWRADIHIAEDVIEEIGRLHGFDSIEPKLPQRDFTAVAPANFDSFRTNLRRTLTRAGANEVLTYSFVHGDTLKKAGQASDKAFRITNALSPELQYYRLSLTPSLLDKVHANLRQRFDSFALYEIGKVHQKEVQDDADPEVPAEFHSLALTLAANPKNAAGTAFYNAKYMLEFLLSTHGITADFYPYVIDDIVQPQLTLPFEPKRTAIIRVNDTTVGVVGEYKASVVTAFKLPVFSAGFELDIAKLFAAGREAKKYTSVSRFPGTEQDVCVQVSLEVTYDAVMKVVKETLQNERLEWSLSPVDIYQPEGADYKNITFRIHLRNRERTIATEEASVVVAYLSEALIAGIEKAKIV